MFTVRIPRADLISKISFSIFIFTTFFGTALPFQQSMQETGADEIVTSNIVNQILYPALFFLSFIAFLPNGSKVIQIIKKEKFLTLFLVYTLISTFWSPYPLLSIKRWFQFFSYYFVIIVFLSYVRDVDTLLQIIKPIIYLYIFISLIAVLIIPQAHDPLFGTWRGLAPTKNNLGQIGLISTILSFIIFFNENIRLKKYIAFLIIFFSLVLTIGTFSSTTYTGLFIFLTITFLFEIKKQIFNRIGAGYFLFFFTLFTLLTLFVMIVVFFPEILDSFQSIFGKEGSFADRAKLWQVILFQIGLHPYFGCGFQGFWIIDSPTIELIYKAFVWLPVQAHNGYLDLLNETGIIGLGIFIIIIIKYIYLSIKNNNVSLWNWFIILPLIMNVTESVVIRVGNIVTVFFILAYLLLYSVDKYRK
jgi:O-antigen ligase